MTQKTKAQEEHPPQHQKDIDMAIEPIILNDGIEIQDIIRMFNLGLDGDAEIFKHFWDSKFLFRIDKKNWFIFNGLVWQQCTKDHPQGFVRRVSDIYMYGAKKIEIDANEITDVEEKKKKLELSKAMRKRALAYLEGKRCRDIIERVREGQSSLATLGEEFDKEPYKIPLKNGILDLKAGDFNETGNYQDYFTKQSTSFNWSGDIHEPCEAWEEFLLSTFDGDTDTIKCLQRVLGMALKGEKKEHKFFILVGKGRNGKSTLINTIINILKPFAAIMPKGLLLDSRAQVAVNGHTESLMALKGLRIAFASETGRNEKLNTTEIKNYTGGEEITGRHAHGHQETFKSSSTLFLSTNFLPKVNDDDYAIWERIEVFPFTLSFIENPTQPDERHQDKTIEDRLEKEYSGIFSWLVRGYYNYLEEGIKPSEKMLIAKGDYKKEEDYIQSFVDDNLILTNDETIIIRAKDLYSKFETWWRENCNNFPKNKKEFGRKLTKLGIKKSRDSFGYRYHGIIEKPAT